MKYNYKFKPLKENKMNLKQQVKGEVHEKEKPTCSTFEGGWEYTLNYASK